MEYHQAGTLPSPTIKEPCPEGRKVNPKNTIFVYYNPFSSVPSGKDIATGKISDLNLRCTLDYFEVSLRLKFRLRKIVQNVNL